MSDLAVTIVDESPFSVDRDKIVTVNYAKDGVTATSYYLLIDLDSSAYPHDNSGARLLLTGVGAAAVKSVIGAKWRLHIGVIMTIDGTSAKVGWLPIGSLGLLDTSQFTAKELIDLFPVYQDLAQTGGLFDKIGTNQYESGITALNTGVTLEDVFGSSVTPAVGDLVLRVELLSGSGSLDFKIGTQYWAE